MSLSTDFGAIRSWRNSPKSPKNPYKPLFLHYGSWN